MKSKILYAILFAFSFGILALAVSPYVNSNPPSGQYHPLSEIWINESTIDWKNVSFVGLGSLTPNANTTHDLGSQNLWWRNAYIQNLYVENINGGSTSGGISGDTIKDSEGNVRIYFDTANKSVVIYVG